VCIRCWVISGIWRLTVVCVSVKAEHDATQQVVSKQRAEIASLSDTVSAQTRTVSEHTEQVH